MEGITVIKEYTYNDPELLDYIKILLGSDEWYAEHKQELRRQAGKKFFLLFDKGEFVAMCSVYKNQITDAHTLPQFRNKGYITKLYKAILKPGYYSGTSNPYMEKVFLKLGMKYRLSRGKYKYYEYGGNCYENN